MLTKETIGQSRIVRARQFVLAAFAIFAAVLPRAGFTSAVDAYYLGLGLGAIAAFLYVQVGADLRGGA